MKRLIILIGIICIVILLSCKDLFRYSKIEIVPASISYNLQLSDTASTLEEAIPLALDITKSTLAFKLKSINNNDVVYLSDSKQAHCVGYSNFYNAILTSILINSNITNYKIYRVRAKVFFAGIEITSIIDNPSFKNHDISVVLDTKTNKQYIIDPSLSELFGNIIQQSQIL